MSVNPFFTSNWNATSAEHKLLQDLTTEVVQLFGRDFYYLPRDLVAFDKLYGEDKLSAFTRYYPLEFYLDSNLTYEGQQEIISKFGFEVRDEMTLTVSKARFNVEVASKEPGMPRPREGDLLYMPLDKSLFEITYANNEAVFYELGRIFTYQVKCKRFELASETFDTGVNVIDNIVTSFGATTQIFVVDGIGDYIPGEIVFQGLDVGSASYYGEVVAFDSDLGSLVLTKPRGELLVDSALIGVDSDAAWMTALQPTEQVSTNSKTTDKASDAEVIYVEDFDKTVVRRDLDNPHAYGYDD